MARILTFWDDIFDKTSILCYSPQKATLLLEIQFIENSPEKKEEENNKYQKILRNIQSDRCV